MSAMDGMRAEKLRGKALSMARWMTLFCATLLLQMRVTQAFTPIYTHLTTKCTSTHQYVSHIAPSTVSWIKPDSPSSTAPSRSLVLHAAARKASSSSSLTPLPPGLSPWDKSFAKQSNISEKFRTLATRAIETALLDGQTRLEIDFPPLIGEQAKSQFDDFDNLSELDANRDWCIQLAPSLAVRKKSLWLVFPDDKEVELAKQTWTGQRYRQAAKFTSIRAAVQGVSSNKQDSQYVNAWGSTFASTVNKFMGGDGILADSSALDDLDETDMQQRLYLVCQPGNGGPVEDWINVERLTEATPASVPMVVVNGALDKVREGYYPSLFFPALARTVPFYQSFTAALVCKPISAQGLYGWLYRIYPEPWQVVLQTKGQGKSPVVNTVALVSEKRPSYNEIVQAMAKTASEQSA
jgi:Domain of unknown function (DUF1995)